MSDVQSIAIVSHEIKTAQASKPFVTYVVKGSQQNHSVSKRSG